MAGRMLAAVAAAAIVTTSAAAAPQQPASTERPAFEAATIKPVEGGANPLPVAPSAPNRLRIPRMTLTQLIYAAYGDGGFNTSMRVTGGPDWANKTPFSVEGVASGPATPRQIRLMLQTLLADRFALKIRDSSETGDAPIGDVLTLVVDRSDGTLGAKVKLWDGTCPGVMPALYFQSARRPLQQVGNAFVVGPASEADDPAVPYCPTGYRAGGMRIDGATMRTVADMLSLPPSRALLGTITQDRTGLTGRYTMELD
ncbi:MAG TPA: TIGR03435 family protein, partial [Vicinamibacterales bacterium]|nr:TIGR03435 family protein [Vicinamibacterales bacterium]